MTALRRLFAYRALWSLVGLILGYAALVFLTPYQARGTGLRGVFLVLSGWGLFAYWRPFRRAVLTEGWPDGGAMYGIMVFLVCASYQVNIVIASVWRFAGQPYYLINNAFFDFWIVLAIASLTIAVTVPDLFGKDVPPRDKIQLGSAWLIMFGIVLFLVVEQPDLRPFAEWIRPVIDMGHDYRDPN